MNYYLIYENNLIENSRKDTKKLIDDFGFMLIDFQNLWTKNFEANDILVFYLSKENLYKALRFSIEKNIVCSLLPHKNISSIIEDFGCPQTTEETLEKIKNSESKIINILYCNDNPVFEFIKIGNMFLFDKLLVNTSLFSKVKILLEKIKFIGNTPFHPYLISKTEGKIADSCALGISIISNPKKSLIGKYLNTEELDEGFYTSIFAPKSIMEIVRFTLLSYILKGKNSKAPKFISYIKSNEIILESSREINYIIDNNEFKGNKLEIKIKENKLNIIKDSNDNYNKLSEKNIQKIQGLPLNESKKEFISRPLPWFKKASTEEFKDLFDILRKNSVISQEFIVLIILSTLVASLGLLSNSAPVIIGAMILAPLMAPIISASMGLVREDKKLLSNSIKTLFIGILCALFFGFFSAFILPLETLTNEIESRLSPNIIDLFIAICSGIAAAYATSREKISQSLAGVAIAVALVPPLAVSGIGIGWYNFNIFYGAFLLFITNLAGIILASGTTFVILGFSPFHRAKKGILLIFISVVLLSIPLGISFSKVAFQTRLEKDIKNLNLDKILISNIQISNRDKLYISIKINSEYYLDSKELEKVEEKIRSLSSRDMILEFSTGIIRK